MHHPTDRIAHTMAFVTPVVEHWLERELAQWVSLQRRQTKASEKYLGERPVVVVVKIVVVGPGVFYK